MKTALTDLSIKRFPVPETGSSYHWDATQQGFGLRIGAGGARTFVVLIGSGQRKAIGRYPSISLADARKEAKRILAEKTLGKVRPGRVAFDDAVTAFLAQAAKRNRPRTVKDYTRLLKHFPFKRKALADITKKEIASRLDLPPSEAAHALVAAKVFFSWCVRQDYLERSPCEGLQGPEMREARERVLADPELAKVIPAAARIGYPFGHIVLLLLFTGQRRGEIAALRWEWISEEDSTITLPAHITKNKRQHTFPYGPAVADLLRDIPRASEYLFPAARSHVRQKATTVFNGWPKATAHLRKLAKTGHFTLHDLRRTVSSGLAALNTPPHVIERILNHATGQISGVAATYNRYAYLPEMRAAFASWEAKLQSLVRG